jgi:hypothetical protein
MAYIFVMPEIEKFRQKKATNFKLSVARMLQTEPTLSVYIAPSQVPFLE